MRTLHRSAVLAALAECNDPPPVTARAPEAAPLMAAASGRGAAGAYIVVLKEGADPRSVAGIRHSTPGVTSGNPAGTPDRLLYRKLVVAPAARRPAIPRAAHRTSPPFHARNR